MQSSTQMTMVRGASGYVLLTICGYFSATGLRNVRSSSASKQQPCTNLSGQYIVSGPNGLNDPVILTQSDCQG